MRAGHQRNPGGVGRGGGLLDDVLAAKPTDVSRTVAQNAASRSGLDAGLLKKMLPMLVAGYMAKQRGAGTASQAAPAGGGLGSILGGLASMLDMNGDGNPLDDILRMAGKALR